MRGVFVDTLTRGTCPEDISFVTFTKRAVPEGTRRSMSRFGITTNQLPFFSTLHSLCFFQLGLSKDSVMNGRDFNDLNQKLNLRLTGSISSDDGHVSGISKDDRRKVIENLARMRQISVERQGHESDDV